MEIKKCEYCDSVASYSLRESCAGGLVGYLCDKCEIDSLDYYTDSL